MKTEKLAKQINREFSTKLMEAFKERYDRELSCSFNLAHMAMISSPADGAPLTRPQMDWLQGYEAGYLAALALVEAAV